MERRAVAWLGLALALGAAVVVVLMLRDQELPATEPIVAARRTAPPAPAVQAEPQERSEAGPPEFTPWQPVPRSAVPATTEHTAPLALALWAAAVKEPTVLRTCYSQRLQQRIDADREGFDGYATQFAGLLALRCGRYAPGDFTFEFTGSATAGKVAIVHRSAGRFPGMQVVREGDRWLLDER